MHQFCFFCSNSCIIFSCFMSQDNMIKLECTECKAVNYNSHKNKKILKDRLEMNKYCPKCRKHTAHKETK